MSISSGSTSSGSTSSGSTSSGSSGRLALYIFGAIAALMVLVIAVVAMSYISAFNRGNTMEKGITATYTNTQNIYAQYGQKVLEVAQVPEMAKSDLLETIAAAIQGRYGENGSQATWQFIQEQNPSLDSGIYRQIQQVIEAGRNDFQRENSLLIDKRRAYETALGSFWGGLWLGIAGYPKIDLAEFVPVTSEAAESVFKAGKETGPIKLR